MVHFKHIIPSPVSLLLTGLMVTLILACGVQDGGDSVITTKTPEAEMSLFPAAERNDGYQFSVNHAPIGFGGTGTGPFNKTDMAWFHNWSMNSAQLKQNNNYLPLFTGGPLPATAKSSGSITCYCEFPYHYCHKERRECLAKYPTSQCQAYQFAQGRSCNPGCANTGSSSTCSVQNDFLPHIQPMLNLVKKYPGRTWLIYNEPDDFHQAALKPKEAARLYDTIYDEVRKLDPHAKLFCCGTHPGSGNKPWFDQFVQHVRNPLDGLHYHNYYFAGDSKDWYRGDKIIEVMKDFAQHTARIRTAGGQSLADLPILVTEWAGLSGSTVDRCSAMNNRDNVMKPVAQWLLGEGRKKYRHIGASWFISQDSHWHSTLYNADGSPTCLGVEYRKYQWGRPSLHLAKDHNCPRLEVALPTRDWGLQHLEHAIVYDAKSNKRLGRLKDFSAPKPPACGISTYYSGADWPDSYFRYFGTNAQFSRAMASKGGFSGSIKVRFEFSGGMPYSNFSNSWNLGSDVSVKTESDALPLRAEHYTYISRDRFWLWSDVDAKWVAAKYLRDLPEWRSAPMVAGGRPYEGTGITAMWTASTGRSVTIVSKEKYWIWDFTSGKWAGSGLFKDVPAWSQAPRVDGKRPFEGEGITAAWGGGAIDGLTVISKDKYWIWSLSQSKWTAYGRLRDITDWANAPSIGGRKAYEGEGVTAAWTTSNGTNIVVVSKDRYWIYNTVQGKWTGYGYFKDSPVWTSAPSLAGRPYEGGGMTAAWE